ncbi:unnamed protein product [Discosporangium mesarthrocarpum]
MLAPDLTMEEEEVEEEEEERLKQERFRTPYSRTEYKASAWGMMLGKEEALMDKTSREALKLRRRFRVPFPFSHALVKEVESQGWLGSEMTDSSGRPGIPVQLKVLAVLQILGRGNCFDDIEQLSGMSESRTQRTFYHFCECFARDMYAKWTYVPEGNDLEEVMPIYEAVGFSGAVGSTDVTHARWERAPISEGVYYMGKEGFAIVVYQVTVDHTGFARGVTVGLSRARNDKTTVRYNGVIHNIKA